MTKTESAHLTAQPAAWITYGTIDGKKSLEIGSVASNLEYIKVHKEWKWQPLYLAATTQASTAQAEPAPSEAELLHALQQAARLLKAAGFTMTGTATSQIIAAINAAAVCAVPPPGWQCTRPAGHGGPCAAIPAEPETATSSTDAQAAAEVRDAALEEAAKACDDLHRKWEWDDEPDSSSGPRDCAAAIRALRAGDTGEQADGGAA